MTILNHDANLLPPEQPDALCRNCSHYGEDHEQDGVCLAQVTMQIRRFAGATHYDAIRRNCDCGGYEPYTRDDWEADEADRLYDEIKSGGY